MRFSEQEIKAAHRLQSLGLDWEPRVGNYVFDAHDSVQPESPFQTGVYFILNYEHFMRLLGGVERFKEQMVWLPTWEDLRALLREQGVEDSAVLQELSSKNSLQDGSERLALYQLLIERLGSASP